jgi:hypothetical protein
MSGRHSCTRPVIAGHWDNAIAEKFTVRGRATKARIDARETTYR